MARTALFCWLILVAAALGALAASDLLPAHWYPEPWVQWDEHVNPQDYGGIDPVDTLEEHVVLNFEAGVNQITKTTWRDPAFPTTPAIPAYRVKHVSSGVTVMIFRQASYSPNLITYPLNLVNVNASLPKFGTVSLSPFGNPSVGTPIVLQVISTGTFGTTKKVARVSLEMADALGSDDDFWQMTLQQSASDPGKYFEGMLPLIPDGSMERAIKSVQYMYPVTYATFMAGSADEFTNENNLNSVYYDNIVLTFQTMNANGTVGKASNAPSTDFGGGGNNSAVTGGPGGVDEQPAVGNIVEEIATLDGLIDMVLALGLDSGLEMSLLAKLSLAVEKADAGAYDKAIRLLDAFIREVEAQDGKFLLAEDVDALVAYAELVIASLTVGPVAAAPAAPGTAALDAGTGSAVDTSVSSEGGGSTDTAGVSEDGAAAGDSGSTDSAPEGSGATAPSGPVSGIEGTVGDQAGATEGGSEFAGPEDTTGPESPIPGDGFGQ